MNDNSCFAIVHWRTALELRDRVDREIFVYSDVCRAADIAAAWRGFTGSVLKLADSIIAAGAEALGSVEAANAFFAAFRTAEKSGRLKSWQRRGSLRKEVKH